MITEYKHGDRVKVTEKSFQTIWNGNRSIHCYPCDSYVKEIKEFIGVEGIVVCRHEPGYDITVNFNGNLFHMKDHWVERV